MDGIRSCQPHSPIRGVIFDMDGTLLDTEQIYARAWRAAGAELHFARVEEAIHACTGRNMNDTRRCFGETFPEISYERFMEARERHYRAIILAEGVPLKPGARELLECFRKKGMRLALGTSTRRERAVYNLETTGLGRYLDAVVTGDMVARGKPDPETFLTAARLLGLEPSVCAGVEDSRNGVRAIRNAGMLTVMVPDAIPPDEETRRLADAVCPDLTAAGEFILRYGLTAEDVRPTD